MTQILELEIEEMNFGRGGSGRLKKDQGDFKVESLVFVDAHESLAPGDRVQVQVENQQKGFLKAKLLTILSKSLQRVEPPCVVFGKCGGCQWQHLPYEVQLEQKKVIFENSFKSALKTNRNETTESSDQTLPELEVFPCREPFGYRSRVQVRGNKDGIGFYSPESNNLVSTDKCVVLDSRLQQKWSDFLKKSDLKALSSSKDFMIEWSLDENGEVLEAFNRGHAAFGFTQVNIVQNESLRERVRECLSNREYFIEKSPGVLLDLYGGKGNLSQGMKSLFRSIVCVDSKNGGLKIDALESLNEQKKELSKYQLVEADVSRFLKSEIWQNWGYIESVILDPPRNGLEEAVHPLMKAEFPRLLLVSCHPRSMARDLSQLLHKYDVKRACLIDMFPQTYHMETLIELVLKKA